MNRKYSRVGTMVMTVALGAVALVGCAPSAEENTANACAALGNLDVVLTSASAELANAETVGDLRAIRDQVSTAYTEASKAVDAVAGDRATSLDEAWSTFTDQVSSIDDEAAVTDARDSLVENANAFAAARNAAQSDLTCE